MEAIGLAWVVADDGSQAGLEYLFDGLGHLLLLGHHLLQLFDHLLLLFLRHVADHVLDGVRFLRSGLLRLLFHNLLMALLTFLDLLHHLLDIVFGLLFGLLLGLLDLLRSAVIPRLCDGAIEHRR